MPRVRHRRPDRPLAAVGGGGTAGLLLSSASVLVFAFAFAFSTPAAATAQSVEEPPSVVLGGVPFSITVRGGAASGAFEVRSARGAVLATGTVAAGATAVASGLRVATRDELPLTVTIGGQARSVSPTLVPGWYSLLPPAVAILMALVFREVLTALFIGVWLGALAAAGFNPLSATGDVVASFVVPALGDVDDGKTQIVVFSMLLGGMVGLVSRNGGTLGVVEALRPLATSARRGKLATWAAGMSIFFDDYANTLIVGNTMRPITDRLRISREKLAYLVDSTAAPVAAIVPISTWVGYEISLIRDGLRIAATQQAANPELAQSLVAVSPFGVFLHTIPYLFYPLLAIAFVLMTSAMNRDFGPMLVAENRAGRGEGLLGPGATPAMDASESGLDPAEGVPRYWWNAAVPVLTVILVVFFGLILSGRAVAGPDASLLDVFSAADPFVTLLWGSLAGVLVAIVLSVTQRVLTLKESLEAFVAGMRAMIIAMAILVLAWSLGEVTEQLGTAAFLSQVLEGSIPLQLLPVLVFLTAGVMAFATGTSWATMAILLPLVIPLTVSMAGPGGLGGAAGFDGGAHYSILLGVISSVLAGAIFGDHCSPISDTTVLSSMASGSDHVDHVRTQLPYAVLVAVVGMAVGDIGTAYGLPNWVALLSGVGILYLVLRMVGRPVVSS